MSRPSLKGAAGTFVRERVVRRLLPCDVTSRLNRNDRIGALYRAWGYVFTNHLEGAYYELGVYRGGTFRTSFQIYQTFAAWLRDQLGAQEPWRRQVAAPYAQYRHHFYAFDTFQGMPDNAEAHAIVEAGHFPCALEEFSQRNRAAGLVEGPGVRYFQGTFADIAARDPQALAALQPAAIVNLDCDLYGSTRDGLALVLSKLQQGAVLLIDDWNFFSADAHRGQRRAAAEFLAAHPTIAIEPWFSYEFVGQAFLVHRRAPAGPPAGRTP